MYTGDDGAMSASLGSQYITGDGGVDDVIPHSKQA